MNKQRSGTVAAVELAQIVFFREAEIDKLGASYPDDLWPRVRKHIGEQQGVLIKVALTGSVAERAHSAEKRPRVVAMMTWCRPLKTCSVPFWS